MAYTLSNLLQDLDGDIGQSESFVATGGTTLTFLDTKIGERLDTKPTSNYAIDSYALVMRDAGGANAAPEGQFQRINAYDSETYKFTVDTAFTVAVAAGDEIMVLSAEFYGRDLITRINRAVQKLLISLVDTTLTYLSTSNNYNLPVAAKKDRPRQVWVQQVTGNDDTYVEVFNYDIIPSASGSVATLRFSGAPGPTGATIKLVYDTYQPTLTTYSSVIHETIHPELAVMAARVAVLEWYANKTEDTERWMQNLNVARNDLDRMKKDPEYRIYRPRRSPRHFNSPI